jgi:uncharacterized membrane protein YdjX (TVP38/TMEM64 family)
MTRKVSLAILVVVLAAALVWREEIWRFASMIDSTDEIAALVRGFGTLGMAVSVGLMIAHSFLPFPAELLACANGIVYGFWMGLTLTWVGAMLGAYVAYFIGLKLGRGAVLVFVSEEKLARAEGLMEKHGAVTLLVARLLPVISFNLVNYVAGMLNVGFWTFTWTTAVGILPIGILSVLAGSHLMELPAHVTFAVLGAVVALLVLGKVLLLRRVRPAVTPSAGS